MKINQIIFRGIPHHFLFFLRHSQEMVPYFTVTCITHRSKPIWQSFISQLPPSESTVIKQVGRESTIYKYQRYDLNMPHVLAVANHANNLSQRLMVIQMKGAESPDIWRTLEAAADYLPAEGKIMVAVDEDINPWDADAVNWAITYRCQPHRDFRIQKRAALNLMDYSIVPPGEGMRVDTRFEHMPEQSRVLIDATMKWAYPPVSLPKREFMEKAIKLWEENGLPTLKLREPWWGRNLGYWSAEDEEQAILTIKGEYYKTGEILAERRRSV